MCSDFCLSDIVKTEEGRVTAAFYRSDPEHHSLAAFAADEPGFDHCAFETPSWNHIRDWADHLAKFDIPIWWGPWPPWCREQPVFHGVGSRWQ